MCGWNNETAVVRGKSAPGYACAVEDGQEKRRRRGETSWGRVDLFVLRLLCEFLLLLCLHRLQEDVLFPEETLAQLLGLVVPGHVRRLVVAVRRGHGRHDLVQ